jgi:hypothetical protein
VFSWDDYDFNVLCIHIEGRTKTGLEGKSDLASRVALPNADRNKKPEQNSKIMLFFSGKPCAAI